MIRKTLEFITLFMFVYSLSFLPKVYSQDIEIDEIVFSFKNTQTFEDDDLISALGVYESDKYDKEKLYSGISKLKKFYFDNGFFDTEIDTSLTFNKDDEIVTIKLKINENKRYKIDTLKYTGLEKITADVSKKVSRVKFVKRDDYYNKVLIIHQTNEILDRLQNNGYMNAILKIDSGTVVKKYEDSPDSKITVIINFQNADSLFYFGRTDVSIKNNVYNVSKELLESEILYKEGDIYSKKKKLDSERNITRFPIVQSTRIEPQTIVNNKVQFSANIILNKKNEVVPYIKGSEIENRFYLGGGVQFADKYFLGGGRVLALKLDALIHSLDVNRIEFSTILTQPHMFNNKKMTLTNKTTLGWYNLEGSKNYYLGNLTTLNYFISEQTFYNSAFLDLNEELVRFNYEDDTTQLLTLFHSFLSVTAVHDNTDDLLSPSKGFYHSITFGNAGLLPKLILSPTGSIYYSQFLKAFTLNKFFMNVSSVPRLTIFAASFKVGNIREYGEGERLVPVQSIYKFFSGGSSSLRGWNAKENGVLDDRLDGGNFIVEGSFELRRKLFRDSENFLKNISGAFFIDYGNVWEEAKDFKFNQIALAIGFGIRYNLFIGPIRVDFGFKLYDPLDPQNEKWLFSDFGRIFKDKFAVHFGIGEAF